MGKTFLSSAPIPSLQLQSSAEAKNICSWPAVHTCSPAHSQPAEQAEGKDNGSPFFSLNLGPSLNKCHNYEFFKREHRKLYTNLVLSGNCGSPALLNPDPSEQLFSLRLNRVTLKLICPPSKSELCAKSFNGSSHGTSELPFT